MAALLGGICIGLSVVGLMWALGRVCGISGILGAAIEGLRDQGVMISVAEQGWRWLFLLGLILGPLVVHGLLGVHPPQPLDANSLLIIVAGLLVGIGTTIGRGCTSGHGVCGMARLSVRSLVATMVFMLSAMMTVYVTRHLLT